VLRAYGRDIAGAPAHTGSAVGRIVQLLHEGKPYEAACGIAALESPTAFPLADLGQAAVWARSYSCDPRNLDGSVVAGSCELMVAASLPCAPDDPTGQPVELRGHVDQLRRGADGVLRVWDLKSGREGGLALLYAQAWQLAAYATLVEHTLGEPCLVGGVIRLRGYDVAGTLPGDAAAHFTAGWDREARDAMMAEVVQQVSWLRQGVVALTPGLACQWCPAGNPSTCRRDVADVLARAGGA
jgi:hypothetical protein